ncbi:MAG: hypothetical protein HYZ63_00870 [Candidatus Andersenbacteria bacterium]|nr:hypothetical protein [Candidatus Andersenbacteria bacterium]
MQPTNTSAGSYLKEDLIRLLITIVLVALICGAVFWLEVKTHFITNLFSAI